MLWPKNLAKPYPSRWRAKQSLRIEKGIDVINPKVRRTLVLVHMYFAAFMAPAFLLVALSGGLYLLGNKGSVQSEQLMLPAGSALNFQSETLESDIRALLESAGVDHKFEYVKAKGQQAETRPTSRTHIEFSQSGQGLQAKVNKPSLQYAMMELHKGHGPKLFKLYQMLVALALLGVVLGGLAVGLLAQSYRRKVLITSAVGLAVFLALSLLA
ncbi:hypothetical protein [Hyphomonas sp. BRH_c22]|uniref:hypothetical protein n=1 Tax=Hyphomonas sp. BRH_c22 TaxID=1629710 RepID=UPI00263706B4|nr:hypothetical protein [Hyphomonas sp. BRH_c22]